MPNGILRIPQNIQLPDAVEKALKTQFPTYEWEIYSEVPDYSKSYTRRANNFHRAFEFLLKAYPPSEPILEGHQLLTIETILTYLKECRAAASFTAIQDINELQSGLEKFTTQLIDMIQLVWKKSNKEATELLNEAEQYLIMSEGRRNIATLSLRGKDNFVLQVDEALVPYDQQILDELEQVKKYGYPKTPAWFRDFSKKERHFMQAYFVNQPPDNLVKNPVKDIENLLESWIKIKQNALNINSDLSQIKQQLHPLPSWFTQLPPHHQEMFRELIEQSMSVRGSLEKFKIKVANINYSNDLEKISKIPQWYWVLSEHQQHFLAYVLKSKDKIEDAISFLSSRHRTLPIVANFAVHRSCVVSEKEGTDGKKFEIETLFGEQVRSSHLATRDGEAEDWPDPVRRRHALSNLIRIISAAKPEQPILVQTLVSPVGLESFKKITQFIANYLPDYQLAQMARYAVDNTVDNNEQKKIILHTNHPLNMVKYLFYSTANTPEIKEFLAFVKTYKDKISEIGPLIDEYESILNSGVKKATVADYVGRELFLSSLEQIMIMLIEAYSYGSCVSGKDRKAIETMHTNAMMLYKRDYGMWPKFQDLPVNRANFVSRVADEYMTRHHQVHAGQNADGADAIQNAEKYFPADIVQEINKRLKNPNGLANESRVAKNNEPKKVSEGTVFDPQKFSVKQKGLCELVPRQLGEQKCTELYTILSTMIPEKELFSVKKFAGLYEIVPAGILLIEGVCGEKNLNSRARISKILEIILKRSPDAEPTRKPATILVYQLQKLLEPENYKNTKFADELISKLKTCFEEYKQKQAAKSPERSLTCS